MSLLLCRALTAGVTDLPLIVQDNEKRELCTLNGFDDVITKGAYPSCFDIFTELGRAKRVCQPSTE